MNRQPSRKLYNTGSKIVRLLKHEGKQAFFVGGVVRNFLLKRESDNIDISTDALPDEIEAILRNNNIKVKPIGKKFGSILAIVDSIPVEITTFRAEGRYSDNRHPDKVTYIDNYEEDARRRDFTINAMYQDPETKEVLDPTKKGMVDLKARLIRFVGDPKKRIDEDALRMLRAVRQATQLCFSAGGGPASGWKLEKNAFAAIKTRAKYIIDLSGERIKAELDKLLLSGNPAVGIELLDKTGLLKFIIPEMEQLKTFSHKSRRYHLEKNIFVHTLLCLGNARTENLELLYALLFHDIGKPVVAKKVLKEEGRVFSTKGHAEASAKIFINFADKYKFSRQSKDSIEWLILNHMIFDDFPNMNRSKQVAMALHPSFELLIQHAKADHYGNIRAVGFDNHTKRFIASTSAAKKILKLMEKNKHILDKLGRGEPVMKHSALKPGKKLGQVIYSVREKIIFGEIKNDKDLRNYLTSGRNISKL